MSWIVQNLWNNRVEIKQKSHPTIRDLNDSVDYVTELNADLFIIDASEVPHEHIVEWEPTYEDPFIESDSFNDLLIIEKAIEDLTELGLLTREDLEILEKSGRERYTNDNRHRKAESRNYYSICQRIAYYLGGYFTDDGYINYLVKKYGLTAEQVETARTYMRSKFKNKILRKGYRIEDNHEKTRIVSAEV